jgi:phospholipase/carboxylesterase
MPALADNLPQVGGKPSGTSASLASAGTAPIKEQLAVAAPTADDPADTVERAADFTYLLRRPDKPATATIVLMHGSGGDETTLMALAEKIAPDANLLGVRGRVRQDGINRWYKRLTPTSFDQQDIAAEAKAFVASLSEAATRYGLDLKQAVFLGYSNGANMIGAVSLLYPKLVRRAVLMRAMPVLEQVPDARLDADILVISGGSDTVYRPFAPRLATLLGSHGARVESRTISSDHMIGDGDARLIGEWLGAADGKKIADAAK